MEFDKTIQIAEMYYDYEGENIVYLINASYIDASWGVDVEDEIVNSIKKNVGECEIEIKEYKIAKNAKEKYSASFKYNGLEYFLVGSLRKEDFEILIDNLLFY